MAVRSKRFQRPTATRSYRKAFHIFMEGEKTEPLYFYMFKNANDIVLKLHSSRKRTSAKQIFDKVKKFVAKEKLSKGDEIWVVVDVDQNTKQDLQRLHEWSVEKEHYGLAISNPKFEYWLLLHFDEGNNISTIEILDKRLIKHLPSYDKNNLDLKKIQPKISKAIRNAKKKFHECNDWYRDKHTTVFQLVEKIMTN